MIIAYQVFIAILVLVICYGFVTYARKDIMVYKMKERRSRKDRRS